MKEIDILSWAGEGDFVVVEKATNRAWAPEEIREARAVGLYQEEDRMVAPGPLDVSGPWPGCLQMGGSAGGLGGFHPAGQTRNFVFFVRAEGP